MKKLTLKMDDLKIESFPTGESKGGVVSQSESDPIELCTQYAGCGTFSLNEPTVCNCSAPGPVCTQNCVEQSQMTDFRVCCG